MLKNFNLQYDNEYLKVNELAEILGVSNSWVRVYIGRPELIEYLQRAKPKRSITVLYNRTVYNMMKNFYRKRELKPYVN